MDEFSTEEFLQEFYEEANEHLSLISKNLLRLEQENELERVDSLNGLFRSFHTLKGLCGMMNLPEGVQISHAMEGLLHSVQVGELSLNEVLLDVLLAGAQTLDEIVAALKNKGTPMPDPAPILRRVQELQHPLSRMEITPPGPAQNLQNSPATDLNLPALHAFPELLATLNDHDRQKIAAALTARQQLMVVHFMPSPARAERGENVDLLRQQLQQAGTILKAAPVMTGGQFVFIFLLAANQPLTAGSTIADEVTSVTEPAVRSQPVHQAVHTTTVRVELSRMDDLMRSAADLIKLRAQLTAVLAQLHGSSLPIKRELQQINHQLGRSLRDLRQSILRARLVPLSEVFNHMPLVVRDLSRASRKEIRLVIQGETSEVDKALVERLLDPLMHLVRNAIAHGIETPEERTAQGKTPYGQLVLRATPEGDHILVVVSDDGRGIDIEKVSKKAVDLGWLPGEQVLSDQEVLHFISRPGFSTRPDADLAAGRGVGLDIVQKMVRAFGGQLRLSTVPGKGSTFSLRLPITQVIMDVIFIQVAGRDFAIPQDALERIIEVDPGQIVKAEAGELLPSGEDFFVVYHLADFIHEQDQNGAHRKFGLIGRQEEHSQATGRPMLLVDALKNNQEVVAHTVTDPYVARPGIGGATELGDGRVVLILDLPAVIQVLKKSEPRWKTAEVK
jgi:two-component system, chemotaxis family, sensor kinase CheA